MLKTITTFILVLSVVILSAGAAFCAAGDVGHVYFVEPENPDPDTPYNPEPQDSSPLVNTNTVRPNTSALRQVVLTSEMSSKIASVFQNAGNKNVYSLMGNDNVTLNTDPRAIDNAFVEHLSRTGEEIMLAFPGITAREAGIYVLGVTTDGIAAGGTLIDSVSTIIPSASASNVHAAADIEQINLLDQAGSPVATKRATNGLSYAVVPENKNMLVAVELEAGESWLGSLTKPAQVPTLVVENVTIQQVAEIVQQTDPQAQTETHEETVERITTNIVNVIQEIISRPEVIETIISNPNIISRDILSRDITSADIKTFTSKDIVAEPEEPTPAMQQAVKDEGYEIVAKLNVVQVQESGFYLFKVSLSEESFNELKGLSAKELKVYALSDTEIEIRASFLTGLLNTFELLSMSGEKMESIGVREFLLIGLLESSKPLSLYLAKLLIMLLLGGCNSGLGVSGVVAVVIAAAYRKFHRK